MRAINKRGLSPLIATILLIAFAVALGAVVMNIGRTYSGDTPFNGDSECKVSGSLDIPQIAGKQKICFKDQGEDSYIDFTIHNSASIDVSDLQITVYGANDVFNKDSILSNVMSVGEGRRIKIKYDLTVYGQIEQITITPKIKTGDSFLPCNAAKIDVANVQTCT